ncbi:WD repeat-containing protein 92-like protein [Blastocladiella britannica]|nr:WD repeat-containing protein 92-like protein [Blastocladiella britannica]
MSLVASPNPTTAALSNGASSLAKPQIINHLTRSVDYTPHDVKWIPGTARAVVVGETPRGTGAMAVYELDSGARSLVEAVRVADRPRAIKCSAMGASAFHRSHLATGDMTGELCVWDLDRTDVPLYRAKAHDGVVNGMDACAGRSAGCGAPEIATAGRDGCVKVWDVRQKDAPVAKIAPLAGEVTRDCWSVAFGNSHNNDERYVAAGYDNGDLKVFDLRAMGLVWETNVKNGVVSVQFDRWDIKANKLAIGTLEAGLHVYDLRTQHPESGFASLRHTLPGTSTVWNVKHSPHNRDLMAATSGQGGISIFKYNYPSKRSATDDKGKAFGIMGDLELLNSANVAEQPVSSFDWSPDKQGLCAYTAFDQTVRVGIVTKLGQY